MSEGDFVALVAADKLRGNSIPYYSSPLDVNSSPLTYGTSATWPGQPLRLKVIE